MTRKPALLTQALAHFAISFICFALLAGPFTSAAGGEEVPRWAGFVIFLLLSYGLRPFLGLVLDEYPRLPTQTAGCLTVAVSCLLADPMPWFSLFLAGIGYALFLTAAGGESLAFARGHFLRNAAVVAPGMVGASFGAYFGRGFFSPWIFGGLLLLCSVACFFFAMARKYPRRIRSFRHSTARRMPAWGILALTAVPAFSISLVRSLLPVTEFNGALSLLPSLLYGVGILGGGILADRFGPRRVAVLGFCIALPLLTVFTHIPWLFCLGLVALFLPTSVLFGGATAALPSHPHFVFGFYSAVMLLGSVPALFTITVTGTVRTVAAVALILSVAVGQVLYTDYCKPSALIRPWEKGEK
ncbi:MAG: hypothetical protein J6M34_06145 [Clostridia bacterium]|nr:hypothetical protein [Clostridia bacterium]